MSIEERLKELILERYGSIHEFSNTIGMSNSTLVSILKRGINGSSVGNVIKICKALRISADELADGKIVPITDKLSTCINDRIEIKDVLSDAKILIHADNVTLDGKPVNDDTVNAISQGIDVSLEIAKRIKS